MIENTIKAFNINLFLSNGEPNGETKNLIKYLALSSNCKCFNETSVQEGVEFLVLLDGFPFKLDKKYLPKSLIFIGIQDIIHPLDSESIPQSIKYLCFDGYSHKITRDTIGYATNIGFGKLESPVDPSQVPKSVKCIQYYFNHNHPLNNIPTPLKRLILSETQYPLDIGSFSTNCRDERVVKKIVFNNGYKFIIDQASLPLVEEVVLCSINQPIDKSFKNSKIQNLYFKDTYPFPIKAKTIPINLKKLKIGNIKHSLNDNSIPKDLNRFCQIILQGYDLKFKGSILPLKTSLLVISGATLLFPNCIPHTIKTLSFIDYQYRFVSETIPKTVNELEFGRNKYPFNKAFIHPFINTITFRASFNHDIKSDMIPSTVKRLGLFDYGERDQMFELKIPNTIKQLILCGLNFDNINIGDLFCEGLESLVIRDCNGSLKNPLPSSIKDLFLFNFCQEINQSWLPPSLFKLSLGSIEYPLSKQSFENQKSLAHLILYNSFNQYPFSEEILPNNTTLQNKEKYLLKKV